MEENKISIIIPIAGIGRRMRSYGPKALIELGGGTTVLQRQLDIIQEIYPKSEIILVSGFEHTKIEKFVSNWKHNRVLGSKDIVIVENKNYENENVARSISLASSYCRYDKILVIYGDLVFNKVTLAPQFYNTGLLIDTNNDFNKFEVGSIINKNIINNMEYGLPNKWAHIGYFDRDTLYEFSDICYSNERYAKHYAFEIFNIMINNGKKFEAYYNERMKVVEIDYAKDIDNARILHKSNSY